MYRRTTTLAASLVAAATVAMAALTGCSTASAATPGTTTSMVQTAQSSTIQVGTYLKGTRTGFTDGTALTTYDQDGFSITFPEAWPNEIQTDPAGIEVIPTDGGWLNVTLDQPIDSSRPEASVAGEAIHEIVSEDAGSATTPARVATSGDVDAWRSGITIERAGVTYRGFVEVLVDGDSMTVVEGVVPLSVWNTDGIVMRAVFDSIALS